MEEWLKVITPNLDKHQLYPLLKFVSELPDAGVDVSAALRQVISKTAMYDLALDHALPEDRERVSEQIEKKKTRFIALHEETKAKCRRVLELFFTESEDEGSEAMYRPKFSMSEMEDKKKNNELAPTTLESFGIDRRAIEALLQLGYQLYDLGWAPDAALMLRLYADIMLSTLTGAPETNLLWGLLAADQLAGNWSQATADIEALRAHLDGPETKITSRVWLLHWSLFTYFKAPGKASLLIDHVCTYPFLHLNVIECAAPHLLRYVAAACILTRRRVALRRIARNIEQAVGQYSDEFTTFIDTLVNRVKFDDASAMIDALKRSATRDFFLCELADDLVASARKLVFEDYIRIHKTVSITYVAERIGKSINDTEMWLANLVREAKIDAKIDSVSAMVSVSNTKSSVYQRVLERLESIDRPSH